MIPNALPVQPQLPAFPLARSLIGRGDGKVCAAPMKEPPPEDAGNNQPELR